MSKKPLASTFSLQGSKYLGRDYDDLDCQALVEAMLRDVGIRQNWRGSNAMYRDMAWVGTPEECVQKFGSVPAGALLYILKDSGEPAMYQGDGVGNADHVGVRTIGGQGAIHSSSSKGGVVESVFKGKTIKNGGWNRVGFCRLLDYGDVIEGALYGAREDGVSTHTMVVKTQGGRLNLRSAPDLSAPKVGDIPNGAEVSVIGFASPQWVNVSYGGVVGYASAVYLMDAAVAADEVVVRLPHNVAEALQNALAAALGGGS